MGIKLDTETAVFSGNGNKARHSRLLYYNSVGTGTRCSVGIGIAFGIQTVVFRGNGGFSLVGIRN